MSDRIKPFHIAVPDEALDLLQKKLNLAAFPENTAFTDDAQHGAPLRDVKRLVGYWQNGFDWRKQEAELNKLPHYTTKVTVDGFEELQIHFIHQPSKRPGSIPLLFSHGCMSTPRDSNNLFINADRQNRARKLFRSHQNASTSYQSSRWTVIPCRSAVASQLWLF